MVLPFRRAGLEERRDPFPRSLVKKNHLPKSTKKHLELTGREKMPVLSIEV